jgi:hypothetical protein
MRPLYLCDIAESPARDGTFTATLRDCDIKTTGRDPEHDICRALIEAGLPDRPIQFYRNGTRSLRFASVHRTGLVRVEMGETFPYRERLRQEGMYLSDQVMNQALAQVGE